MLGARSRWRRARRGMLPRTPRPVPSIACFSCISQFLPAVLEEELEGVCREVTDLQRHLGEVEDQREALEDGALAVFRVVEP